MPAPSRRKPGGRSNINRRGVTATKRKTMKTLDQIIKRNDYKRLSIQLANKAEELAEIIMSKMKELDIRELKDLKIVKRSANSGHNQDYLIIVDGGDFSGALNVCQKSTGGKNREGFYYAGDFNCWIDFAKNDDVLHFLNFFQNYLEKLEEIENEKCAEIEKHLN